MRYFGSLQIIAMQYTGSRSPPAEGGVAARDHEGVLTVLLLCIF